MTRPGIAEPTNVASHARAGASQAELAARASAQARALQLEVARLQAQARRNRIAVVSERSVATHLQAMEVWGWRLLVDRRWATSANLDMVHIGPGGVLVVDAKAWAEARITGTTLWRGDAPADDDVDTLLAATARVEEVVADVGLSPAQVHPVLVFTGRAEHMPSTPLGRVVALGERALVPWATRLGYRLSDEQVALVASALDEAFPPHTAAASPAPALPPPSVVLPPVVVPRVQAEQLPLLDTAELVAAVLEAALAQPIETWMTFLHPAQLTVVRRSVNGPGRVRGPAGTGKTVIGLHRTAHLASQCAGDERVLYATFVRTLPEVLASLYGRLSPQTKHRVEFTGLHRWALALLRERRVAVNLDASRARTLFNRSWVAVGRGTALDGLDLHPDYWHEEVLQVVKGRGLTEHAQYRDLRRVGRRTPLQPAHRDALWELHTAYDIALREEGVHDFADVLSLALAEVRARPLTGRYRSVVVDEVQDLTLVGVQLLHALVGDRPDGLLLIGDGQQAVYPGGFTLTEAGIAIPGARSTVLRSNYRNAAEVLDAAVAVLGADEYDDLDETSARDGAVEVVRRGGLAVRVEAADEPSLQAALLGALRDVADAGGRLGDCAVLTATTGQATRWRGLLHGQGIAVLDLENYRGTTCERVKVGTIKRAKGLEFSRVYLPLEHGTTTGDDERAVLARREVYVGITRARDAVWIGEVTRRVH